MVTSDMRLRLIQLENLASRDDVFIAGMVIPYAGADAPPVWILCDGGTLNPILRPKVARINQIIEAIIVVIGDQAVSVPDLQGRPVEGTG